LPIERLNADEVAALVASHYGVPAGSIDVKAIQAGPATRAWRIDVRADRRIYCLKLHRLLSLQDLQGEHKLLSSLQAAGFSLSPTVTPCTTGDTAFEEKEGVFAMYRFIESAPPFDWTRGGWSIEQAKLAGAALAEFHTYGAQCQALSLKAAVQAADLREWGLSVLQRASGMFPDDVMIKVSRFEDVLRGAFAIAADTRSHGVIHGDFHPGNVLYQDGQVVGVLDYEYCRVDSRLFDVAYATMTFSFEHMEAAYALAVLDGYNSRTQFAKMDMAELQPLVRLSAWLSGIWLIEQCQKGNAEHDEILPALRKCIAILSATLD
jgi:Ser/Thr protein kinase RdoA (MazF antagonist)